MGRVLARDAEGSSSPAGKHRERKGLPDKNRRVLTHPTSTGREKVRVCVFFGVCVWGGMNGEEKHW